MKMKITHRRMDVAAVCLLLACAMLFHLTGCGLRGQAEDVMKGITPENVTALTDLTAQSENAADFAVRLFQARAETGKNTLLSPLSVLSALSMTANGAAGETLSQMEAVLGMPVEDLNLYLYSYMQDLPQDKTAKLCMANSIWFTDDTRFTVSRDFLQTNADYYGADIFKAPFDRRTCSDINHWVKQKTNRMIPEILDEIPPDAVMYLVNALAFEAEWTEVYKKDHVREDVFTKEDGTGQTAEFMYGTESHYLEDEKATGFLKYYKDRDFCFAALLPREGVGLSELIASLDGKRLYHLLAEPDEVPVHTAIPKFETSYDTEMSEMLKTMGMTDAFDVHRADFHGLGASPEEKNIYIGRVLHKTFISVGEKGTKAGAASVVEMKMESAEFASDEAKMVYLDRPFVYMLVDCENHVPIFIGAMNDMGE